MSKKLSLITFLFGWSAKNKDILYTLTLSGGHMTEFN